MRGKKRLDLAVDPPPDLALEIDITSPTHIGAYEGLGVSEVWRRKGKQLQLYRLQKGRYVEVEISPTFPELPLKIVIPQFLEQSRAEGRNKAMKAFRQWVRGRI